MKKNKNGSAVFIVSEGKLLLILRDDKPTISNPSRYALPGGGAKKKETGIGTIIRELNEELSLKVSEKHVREIGVERIGDKNYNFFFLLQCTQKQKYAMKLKEGQSMKFCLIQEIQLLLLAGNNKNGLGGAIFRLMSRSPDVVSNILSDPDSFKFFHI